MTQADHVWGRGLDALFAPSSIAVIGSSGDPRRIGGRPLHYLTTFGFPGRIYPINPKYEELQGLRCYPDIGAVPEQVDLAVICLGSEHVLSAVESCIEHGVRSAVVFAAEFAEHSEEGRRKQRRLTELARDGGMRILGPNTVGHRDVDAGVFGTFSTDIDAGLRSGNLAVITQSGGLGVYYGAALPRLSGFGARYMIDTGNEADVDAAECIEYVSRDPEVAAIGAVLESNQNGRRIVEACKLARERGKIVVVLKIGRTDKGAVAAESHTGALAGEDAGWDAALRAGGVLRVPSEVELFDVLSLFATGRPPVSNRVGLVSLSGGIITLMLDACSDEGLEVPEIDLPPRELLRGVPESAKGNPLDVSANLANNPQITGPILGHVLEQDDVDALVLWMAYLPLSPALGPPIIEQVAAVARASDKPLYLTGLVTDELREQLAEANVPVFTYPTRLLRAIALASSVPDPLDPTPQAPVIMPETDETTVGLTGPEAEAVLAGIPFAPSRVVTSPDEAADAASSLGFPVVMKGEAPGLMHKTELGLVRVGIAGTTEAARTFHELSAALELADRGGEGAVVVQAMVSGTECFAGYKLDPVFGPTVTFGLGGALVELEQDVVTLLAPAQPSHVLTELPRLRGYPRLLGLRGESPRNVDAFAALIAQLSEIAIKDDHVREIDLNPIMLDENGATAVDSVVVRRSAPSD